MMFSKVRASDRPRDDDVLFIKTPPVEFCAAVLREQVLGSGSMRARARDWILEIAIFSLALVLTVGVWSCSGEPPMHGAVGTPHEGMGDQVPVSPTATPTAMPTPTPAQ